MISQEDKLKIVARLFFQDNPDQYEDYHEALTEFMGQSKPSDAFINSCVEHVIKPQDGCAIVMSSVGHVASVRIDDGFFEPRTDMSDEECEAVEDRFQETADENPDLDGLDLLVKMDWKKIA